MNTADNKKNNISDTALNADADKSTKKPADRMKRFFACLGLLFIAVCLIGLILCTALGSDPGIILMFLFGLIVVPVIFYAFSITAKLVSKDNRNKSS